MRSHLAWWGTLLVGLIIQTTLLPHFIGDAWRPDITRALALWAALTGLPRGGAICSFVSGLAIDATSGAALGFHALCRLVVYGTVRPMRGVLAHTMIVIVFGPLAVVIDTILTLLLRTLLFPNTVPTAVILGIGARQLVVETLTVPLVFLLMEAFTGYRSERQVIV
jgi:rod shape-determining protein MreD